MLIEKLSCCLGVYNFAKIKRRGFIEKILWRNRTNIYSNYMGSGFVATQFALDGGLTPLQIITLRFFLAAIIMNLLFLNRFVPI